MKRYNTYQAPIGPLFIAVDESGRLTDLAFLSAEYRVDRLAGPMDKKDPSATAQVEKQLDEYFAGRRKEFDVELAPSGTPFQVSVWNALSRIPYGETRSYLDIAREVGKPEACRAVGAANGANPIAIVVPCHRVIGANGKLTGFGGGLPTKQRLLELEGALATLNL